MREHERLRKLAEAQAAFEQHVLREYQQIREHYAEIDAFQRDLDARSPAAIVSYFTLVLSASSYPDDFPNMSNSPTCLSQNYSLWSMISPPYHTRGERL